MCWHPGHHFRLVQLTSGQTEHHFGCLRWFSPESEPMQTQKHQQTVEAHPLIAINKGVVCANSGPVSDGQLRNSGQLPIEENVVEPSSKQLQVAQCHECRPTRQTPGTAAREAKALPLSTTSVAFSLRQFSECRAIPIQFLKSNLPKRVDDVHDAFDGQVHRVWLGARHVLDYFADFVPKFGCGCHDSSLASSVDVRAVSAKRCHTTMFIIWRRPRA